MGTTPGPWDIQNKGDLYGSSARLEVVKGLNKDGKTVLPTIATLQDLTPEAYANARLMATAPDLLSALEQLHTAMTAAPAKNWLHLDAEGGEKIDEALEGAWAAMGKAKEERR